MTSSHKVPRPRTGDDGDDYDDIQGRQTGVDDSLRGLGLGPPMIPWGMTVPYSCSRIQRGRVVLGGNPPLHCHQGSSIGHHGVLRYVAVVHLFLRVRSKTHR